MATDCFHWLCLPRASGDRPWRRKMRTMAERSAPRERGSTLAPHRRWSGSGVCPARAGIDLLHMHTFVHDSSLPRASGDRPSSTTPTRCASESAPRERGSTLGDAGLSRAAGVCPARAGIDPTPATGGPVPSGLPRASGDRPLPYAHRIEFDGSAPRERGSTCLRSTPLRRSTVCPARAGIDPRRPRPSATSSGLPRASGDRPSRSSVAPWFSRSAPRERGSTRYAAGFGWASAVCPARAGIDPVDSRAIVVA